MLQTTHDYESLAVQSAIRDVAATFISGARVHPDRERKVPEAALEALAEMGLLSPGIGSDDDDAVPSHLTWTLIAEELGVADAGTGLEVITTAYASIVLSRCGTDEQRTSVTSGTGRAARGSLLHFEGFGRSPLELETTVSGPESGYAVSGRKISAVRLATADFGIVTAHDEQGLRAVLLDRQALDGIHAAESTSGAKVGARAADTSTAIISDLHGGAVLLAGEGIELHRIIAGFRLAVAAILIGTASAAIRYAAAYASGRQAFGRPISAFQGVAFPLVEAEITVDASRLAIQDLASRIEDIADPAQLADLTTAVVAGAAQAGTLATATAVNTLGGHGYLTDHPAERWYRDAAVLGTIDHDLLLSDWSGTR